MSANLCSQDLTPLTSQLSAVTYPLYLGGLYPTAPIPHLHLVPFNSSCEEGATQDQGAKGCRSRRHQLQAPEVLRRSAVWHHGIHVQPEPEAGESTTTVEDILCGTGTKEQAPKGS